MGFHWSLSDSNSPQVSRTLLSILADLKNAVVWIVSTRPLISKSFSPCINPNVTVPRAPIPIGITATFTFHSFFNSRARSKYLSFFSLIFNFTLFAETAKWTNLQDLPSLWIITRSGRLAEIKWSVCMSKSQMSLCASFSRTDVGCAYTICAYDQIQFLVQFPVDHLAHPVVSNLIRFLCQFAAFAYYVIDRFFSITA